MSVTLDLGSGGTELEGALQKRASILMTGAAKLLCGMGQKKWDGGIGMEGMGRGETGWSRVGLG